MHLSADRIALVRVITDAGTGERDTVLVRVARWAFLVCAACSSPPASPDALDRCAGVPAADTLATATRLVPDDLALDDEYVYWSEFRGNAIRRVHKLGGTPQTIATDRNPQQLAVDATDVYWVTGDGNVKRADKSGGVVEQLAAGPGCGNASPCGIALAMDDDALYWAEQGTPATIMRLPKSGGAAVALDALGLQSQNFVVDAQHIYYGALSVTGKPHQEVRRIPKLGGAAETLFVFDAPLVDLPPGIAHDATHLYVARERELWRIAKNGRESTLLADVATFRRVSVDSSSAYVTGSGMILEVALEGGTPVPVACNRGAGTTLASDAARLYWIDDSTETIAVISK